MKPYQASGGDSGVAAYDYGEDWISIQFKHGGTYYYRSADIGRSHLSSMKKLADSGKGLNTYINTHPEVKEGCS